MKKRILSILLTLCMLLCLAPTSVFAEGEAATGTAAIQYGSEWDGGSFHSGGTGFSNQISFIRNSQTDVRHYHLHHISGQPHRHP